MLEAFSNVSFISPLLGYDGWMCVVMLKVMKSWSHLEILDQVTIQAPLEDIVSERMDFG